MVRHSLYQRSARTWPLVELGEHELLRAAFDSQPQRRGAGGGLQADRLDLGHREPELVSHGLADRLPPPAVTSTCRVLAAPVGDGETPRSG